MAIAPETRWSDRRADIDYLRVGALLLLIVYHVLLVFNSWDWWRVKSEHAGYWADYITGVLTPWRMSLVFFVGGVAARFMMERARAKTFVIERAGKLLTAFAFAVIVLVPLQRYVRLDNVGAPPESYLDFWLHQSRYSVHYFGIWLPDFAHAWFLPYLFVYSVCGVAFFRFAPTAFAQLERLIDGAPAWAPILATMLWFAFVEAAVLPGHPVSGLLFPDPGAHVKYAPLFLLGLLLGKSQAFTAKLVAGKRELWLLAGALLAGSITLQWRSMGLHPHTPDGSSAWFAVRGLYGGAMLFSTVAFASWALTKPTRALTYATDAILPVYLMHQTILVVVADAVVGLHWPLGLELLTLLSATALIPLGLYHVLVRHTSWLRVLFGLRPRARAVRSDHHHHPDGLIIPVHGG